MNIGIVIKALRSEKELSQEALALEVDTATSNLSRIEKGIRTPSLDLLYRLAKALDIKVSELFRAAEGGEMPIYNSKLKGVVQHELGDFSDYTDDAIQFRRLFRELTSQNRCVAIELLKALTVTQDICKKTNPE